MVTDEPQTVTFVFPDKTGTRTGLCTLAWQKGMDIHRYLHAPALKHAGLLALARKMTQRTQDGQKVRKTYNPVPGDVIVFQRVKNIEGR